MKNKIIALISAMAMVVGATTAFAARTDVPGTVTGTYATTVSGIVWNDADDNEQFGEGDFYVANVSVSLLNATTRDVVATATTDDGGFYTLGADAGDYILRFVVPSQYAYHTMATFEGGTTNGDYVDIGGDCVAEYPVSTANNISMRLESRIYELENVPYLEGYVWYDANGNGVRPAYNDYENPNSEGENEVGIPGAVVTVTDATGQVIADGETDQRGQYSLDIKPGVCTVTVTLPSEYKDYVFTNCENGSITQEFISDESFVDFGINNAPAVSVPPVSVPPVSLDPSATATPTPGTSGTPDTTPSPGATPTATTEPTATPDITATDAPEPTDMPIPTQMPELNKTEHYAYVVGYPDGMIKPENNITRQEVASIFFRLLTDATRDIYYSKTNSFEDISSDLWSNTAISTMTQAGVITGYKDNTFKPVNNITRAEFATIAAKFDSGTYLGPNKFNDIDGHWAAEYINRAAERGWISGYDNGSFRPDAYITRAEAMTLINNVLERHVNVEDMTSDMTTFPDNTEDKWYYTPVQEATNSHYYEKKSDGYEKWTQLRETRNWAELER